MIHARKLAAAAACVALHVSGAGCDLSRPSTFGRDCSVDDECTPLICDLATNRCLPKVPTPPPDTLGRSCDEPAPLAEGQSADLMLWSGTVTLTQDNTTALALECGRALLASFEVPPSYDAGGVERPAMVAQLRASSRVAVRLALDDEGCTLGPRCETGSTPALSADVEPWLTPGTHRLWVIVDDPLDAPIDVALEIEQVRCPAGFLPEDDGGCFGFVRVRGPAARTGASVTELADGAAIVAGGRDADGLRADAYLFDPQLARFFFSPMVRPRAGHAATRLTDGSVLLVGGDTPQLDAEVFDANGRYFYTSVSLLDSIDIAAPDTFAVALPGAIAAVVANASEEPLMYLRPTFFEGGDCGSSLSCTNGLVCIPTIEGDGQCKCVDSGCASRPDYLTFGFAGSDLSPTAYRRGVALAVAGPTGPVNAAFLGGGRAEDADSATSALTPFRGALFFGPGLTFLAFPAELSLAPRLDLEAVAWGGRVVAVGGRAFDETPLDLIEAFSPFLNEPPRTWRMREARTDFSLASIGDLTAIAIGGRGADGSLLYSTEIIDVDRGTVRPGPRLPVPLADASAAALGDDSVLVVGGTSDDGLAAGALWLVHHYPALDAEEFGSDIVLSRGPDACADAVLLSGTTGSLTAATFEAENDYDWTNIGVCTGETNGGADVVYAIDLPARASLRVRVSTDFSADPSLYILDGCPPNPAACVAGSDIDGVGLTEEVETAPSDAGRRLYIVVDSYYEDAGFPFTLEWVIDEG